MISVGILSMQKIDNFGSVLQAYGLKKTLETFGCKVFFMDIEKNEKENLMLEGDRNDYSFESDIAGLHVSKINKYLVFRIWHRIYEKYQKKINDNFFETFRKQYLNIDEKQNYYDICVIGSDEVFNCLNPTEWGFTTQLFGNVRNCGKVLTYAASCGATRYDDVPNNVINCIRNSFNKVSAFSVRDYNTELFVSRITHKNIFRNVDPVLVYDFRKELELTNMPKMPKRYCVIYAYHNRIYKKRDIQSILTFCRKHGMIPVSLCGEQFWCRRHVFCTPFECLKIFENASFVITDTFHGTIFSAKYAKKFAVCVRQSNQNKLLDLINTLEIEAHLISNWSELDKIYELEKDEEHIENIIINERKKTFDYFEENINGKKSC